MNKLVRIDKYLSHVAGITRSEVKKILKIKSISINGCLITDPGTKFNPEKQKVYYQGNKLKSLEPVYFRFNKPKGIISSRSDALGRSTIYNMVDIDQKIFSIGRLDKDTRGLLILTNDGKLTHQLLHPRFHVPKEYCLTIAGLITPNHISLLENGIQLSDGITLPSHVTLQSYIQNQSKIRLTVIEGRTHMIRRMCYALHLELLDLQRTAFGPITLTNLTEGVYKPLTKKEIGLLRTSVSLASH